MLTPEAGAKIHADMAAKEATLSEPAKALYQKFKVCTEHILKYIILSELGQHDMRAQCHTSTACCPI